MAGQPMQDNRQANIRTGSYNNAGRSTVAWTEIAGRQLAQIMEWHSNEIYYGRLLNDRYKVDVLIWWSYTYYDCLRDHIYYMITHISMMAATWTIPCLTRLINYGGHIAISKARQYETMRAGGIDGNLTQAVSKQERVVVGNGKNRWQKWIKWQVNM